MKIFIAISIILFNILCLLLLAALLVPDVFSEGFIGVSRNTQIALLVVFFSALVPIIFALSTFALSFKETAGKIMKKLPMIILATLFVIGLILLFAARPWECRGDACSGVAFATVPLIVIVYAFFQSLFAVLLSYMIRTGRGMLALTLLISLCIVTLSPFVYITAKSMQRAAENRERLKSEQSFERELEGDENLVYPLEWMAPAWVARRTFWK